LEKAGLEWEIEELEKSLVDKKASLASIKAIEEK
jgi:hypothetical protein